MKVKITYSYYSDNSRYIYIAKIWIERLFINKFVCGASSNISFSDAKDLAVLRAKKGLPEIITPEREPETIEL